MIPQCILVIEDDSDREFMTEFYLQYQRLMYKEGYKITRNHHETEDVMQEALVKLIDKIPLLRTLDRKRRINYVISATKNTAINLMNRKKPMFSFDEMWDSEANDDIADLEERMELNFKLECLAEIWPRLDQRSSYLLEAYYILEKSTEEIAADLDAPAGSVRMFLTRARKRAHKLITEEMEKRGGFE